MPVGAEPPDERDFQTDADIDELIRQRLDKLIAEFHGA